MFCYKNVRNSASAADIFSENKEKNVVTEKPIKQVDDQVELSNDLSDDEISLSNSLAEIQDGNEIEWKCTGSNIC